MTKNTTTKTQPPQIADELRRQADAFIDLAEAAPHFSKPKSAPSQTTLRTFERDDRP